jgi:CO dehydrogenase maturation factor
MTASRPIVAVCGKGGVGKTVVTALMARAVMARGVGPVLLIDADPVGGLTTALGETGLKTLAGVREKLIGAARHGDAQARQHAADQLDYFILEALAERKGHAVIAMGRTTEKGCFCPANTLLRKALAVVVRAFPVTFIDAEAGVEQINRQVTDRITHAVVVTDGSKRSRDTLEVIAQMLGPERVHAVENRSRETVPWALPAGIHVAGRIPEDGTIRGFDAQGTALWELPRDNPALVAAGAIVEALGLAPVGGD